MFNERLKIYRNQKKFFTSNLKDYQMLLIILAINLILFVVFYSSAMIFSDSSREIYIPMAMNDGAVLYKISIKCFFNKSIW